METLFEKIRCCGILPVVAIPEADKAVPLAKACADAGLAAVEITFRTDCAAESIRAIRAAYPDMLIGAGTVLSKEQADRAIRAGADFLVTPGFNPSVVEYILSEGYPVLPGTSTPAEMEQAMALGLSVLKFFPAEQSGGPAKLKAVSGPYPELRFIPTGGISAENFRDYLALKNVAAVGGSFMIDKKLLAAGDYAALTDSIRGTADAMLGMELMHVGFNFDNESAALETAEKLKSIFSMPYAVGHSSVFSGRKEFELMKSRGRGDMGHIAIGVTDIDRAVFYLQGRGAAFDEDSLVVKNGEKIAIYLRDQIAGFAFHLVKK